MALYHSSDHQTSFESTGLLVQEKFNIHFQDGGYGSHLGFSTGRLLAILIYKSS